MKKYWSIFKTSWQDSLVYRLNFVMWRVRTNLQFLAVYFLWLAIFNRQNQIFTYDKAALLTYILGTSVLRSFVLSSRSITAGVEIANGDLNNYLLKPLSYLKNWLARDLADKALNMLFMTFELALILYLLKPPILPPAGLVNAVLFLVSALIAMLMYFLFSFLISSFTFWYTEHEGWPLRFIVFMIIEFLAGSLFPLDIFPPAAFNFFRLLPTAYFLFYPLQLYLGRLAVSQLMPVFSLMLIWLIILYLLAKLVWQKGLKIYGAYGR